MEIGAYDYLIKPTKIEELVEKIGLANRHKKITLEERNLKIKTINSAKKKGWDKWTGKVSGLFRKGHRKKSHSDL
jgi:DNA-binding response OmpR family regulator